MRERAQLVTYDSEAPNRQALLPHHQRLLDASAISREVADARGYWSASKPGELNGRFDGVQRRTPALVIPVLNTCGEEAFCQLRPDNPRGKDGKTLRYETPYGQRMVLDVPPSTLPHIGNPNVTLWITEGIRKADALASVGLRSIALLGVWNWRGRNEHGGLTALADWNDIALNDRKVVLAFDSDLLQNAGVYRAVEELGRWLEAHKARPHFVYLSSDGTKVGADDYLADHSKDELVALIEDRWRPLASEAAKVDRGPDDTGALGAEPARRYPEPMRPEAFRGLAGDVVRTLEPHSEADPVALLMHFLLAFGNAIGRGPGLQIEGNFHPTNEYVALVGETSKGRKGTAHGRITQLFKLVDEEWATGHQRSGLVSGEGLIWEVRDPITKRRKPKKGETADEDGFLEELEDAGIEDKRLMVIEPEFASVLAVTRRDGNTLSMTVRDFWDQLIVRTLAKNSPARSTGALVTIVGHITVDELRRELTDTAKANGFANRFMFLVVRRSKALPFGGSLSDDDLRDLARRVRSALTLAQDQAGSLSWGDGAELWERVYPGLSAGRSGMLGAVTARAETHVLRLAVLYALLDSKRALGREHIEAGLAVWRYCERSAAYVFGGLTGAPLADRLLDAIRDAGDAGIARGELRHGKVGHAIKTERFDAALGYLERCLLAERRDVATGGRPAERWFLKVGRKPDSEDESQLWSPQQGFGPTLSPDASDSSNGAEPTFDEVTAELERQREERKRLRAEGGHGDS